MSDNDLAAILHWVNLFTPDGGSNAARAEDLSDGVALFRALSLASPRAFPMDGIKPNQANWVLKRANITYLVSCVTQYCRSSLGNPALDVSAHVDCAAAAKSDPKALRTLAEVVLTVCVLSGSSDILPKIRQMERADQEAIHCCAKKYMCAMGLRAAKKVLQEQQINGATPAAADTLVSTQCANPDQPPLGSQMRVFEDRLGDSAVLFEENKQLQRRLIAVEDDLRLLRSENDLVKKESKEINRKYRSLQEVHAAGPSAKERELQQMLSRKDERISELSESLESSKKKIAEKLEAVADAQKNLLKVTEENAALKAELIQRSEDRNDILSKLQVAQDSLALIAQLRSDVEQQLGEKGEAIKSLQAKLDASKNESAQRKEQKLLCDERIAELENKLGLQQERCQSLETELGFAKGACNGDAHDDSQLGRIIDSLREDRDCYKEKLVALQTRFEELQKRQVEKTDQCSKQRSVEAELKQLREVHGACESKLLNAAELSKQSMAHLESALEVLRNKPTREIVHAAEAETPKVNTSVFRTPSNASRKLKERLPVHAATQAQSPVAAPATDRALATPGSHTPCITAFVSPIAHSASGQRLHEHTTPEFHGEGTPRSPSATSKKQQLLRKIVATPTNLDIVGAQLKSAVKEPQAPLPRCKRYSKIPSGSSPHIHWGLKDFALVVLLTGAILASIFELFWMRQSIYDYDITRAGATLAIFTVSIFLYFLFGNKENIWHQTLVVIGTCAYLLDSVHLLFSLNFF